MKDEDWIDLLAGRDVEGVPERDKKVMATIRRLLLEDVGEGANEVTEDELEAERAMLEKLRSRVVGEADGENNRDEIEATVSSPQKEKPVDNVIRTNRFRRVVIPLAMAASVAMVVVAIDQYDPYLNESPGFRGILVEVRGGGESIPIYEIESRRPSKTLKKIKGILVDSNVEYQFNEDKEGWWGQVEVTEKSLPKLNQAFKKYGFEIERPGLVKLLIKEG